MFGAQEDKKMNPFLSLALAGNLTGIQTLYADLQASPDGVPVEYMQRTAISATINSKPDILSFCFDHGAVPNGPLVSALIQSQEQNLDIYDVILRGIENSESKRLEDSTIVDKNYLLFFTIPKGEKVVDHLLSHDVAVSSGMLAKAARDADIPTVQRLLAVPGVELKDSGALQTTAAYGSLEMVKFLIETAGAEVDEVPSEDPGDPREVDNGTALHKAVGAGRLDMVKYLLEKGADPKLIDQRQRSALDIAKAGGYADSDSIAKVLEESLRVDL